MQFGCGNSSLDSFLQEAAHAKELAEWDVQIRARNDELARLTSENTRCLTAVADHTRSQMDMEHTLANTQVLSSAAVQRAFDAHACGQTKGSSHEP